MPSRGARVSAAARRRYFALGAVGILGLVFALAIAMSPALSTRPLVKHTIAGAPASPVTGKVSTASKLAAEAEAAANPMTDTTAAQALAAQPSCHAAPKQDAYPGYQFQVPGSWPVY